MNKLLQIASSILFVLIIIILGVILAHKINKKYVYVDMNGSNGTSSKCYYSESSRDMRCLIPVKVQQYSEEK